MVKHNNEIPHQHFKKDWQGYVIHSFNAAFIVRVLENARRIAFFFLSHFFFFTRPQTLTGIHPFFYYRNCSQSFVRTWFNQAGRKKSRRIGTFIQLLFELARRVWCFRVHFRPTKKFPPREKQSPLFGIFAALFLRFGLKARLFARFSDISSSLFALLLNSTREESEGYVPAPSLWCFEAGGPMPDAKIQL